MNCSSGRARGLTRFGSSGAAEQRNLGGGLEENGTLIEDEHFGHVDAYRKYIYGGHVAAYMGTLIEDEPEKYQTHFSEYIKKGIEADGIEELYKKVHAAIRADPLEKKTKTKAKPAPKEHKRFNLKKLTYEERKDKLIERLNAFNSAAQDDDDEDDE